METLKQQSKGP